MSSSELRLPALELRQGERHLYQFALDGRQLQDVSTVSRVRRDAGGAIAGYQRPEVLRHVRSIRAYLQRPDALMPNALVIAFDSRVRFEPAAGAEGGGTCAAGTLTIPLDGEKPGWLVDGQQRAAALRDADRDGFPLPVVAFVTNNLEEQRAQFILVNNAKPLPKGLTHELLPVTDAPLPVELLVKRQPATLLGLLNLLPGSPLQHAVRTPTMPEGRIRDTAVLRMIGTSLADGALYECRDPRTGAPDEDAMVRLLHDFWEAVARTWPEAWALPPRQSRLTHGVGIMALGHVMDEIAERSARARTRAREKLSAAHSQRQLEPLVDVCAWTAGRWELGPDDVRPWDALQVTSRDVTALTDLLLRTYRRARPIEHRRGRQLAHIS